MWLLEITQITLIEMTLFLNVHQWPWVISRQSGKSNKNKICRGSSLQTSIVDRALPEGELRAKECVTHTTADSTRRPFQSSHKIMRCRTRTSMQIMTEVRKKRLATSILDEANTRVWINLESFVRAMFPLVGNPATKTAKLVPLFVDPKWLL